ncbi:MAG: cytochrome c oxidase subunit II [Phenylobacterium sp. RIFCSPHIGHO2_01_FULL_69_31]|uniref:cytochrome c oxidase subunit II n=1 Tax=Phenylobacterium sp. RIFCSPHIGHO2_01_FULL_69_31 TaxID=1801944 RepID=UPI0008D39C83|nr:cytochrome c oxidase subunit II [Phenylobacterium sp. RIFCSPHIGHO2_01_FULL_69_31]OHB29291.1 MAG: cytochrome c oxidase subunit II [Phenylobacterium sp. RIFCSPHIGHO2_01_FULL_69_31]
MKSSFHGLRTRAAGALAGAATAFWGAAAMAADKFGQPTDKAIDLQPGVTPLRDDAIWFHNVILLPIITVITLFVLALLVWVVVRYNKRANPVPAKWSHNTLIEVVWTLAPVLILVFISIFSFRLLFAYNDMPKPDLTIKATGYQWYWGYEYPDQKIGEFVSNMLPEDEAKAKDVPFRLAANEPMVVPVNKVVRVQVTGADVIHAFAVPSFGVITDAIPGRLNETWFKANRIGTYYGNCRELCGVDHAFMPIEVRVVSQADFDAWVASKGGSKAGAAPAVSAAAPAAADAAAAGQPAAATSQVNPAAPPPATPEPKAPAAATTPAPSAPAAK